MLELFAAPIPSWRGPLCLLSISGYLAYIYSSEAYKPFNNGIWFIWGAFLISCAAELKILTLVLDKRQFDTIIRRGKGRFIQFGLVAMGNVIFLLGTLIFWKIPILSETGCIFNFVGGCFVSLSIGSFFIGQ
jgi:heme O synthase-like polyprenyltransferase